jgi:hypothetical protein
VSIQLVIESEVPKTQKKGIPPNFHEFWSEEVHCENCPKKKTLMFECYNLMDPKEWWAIIF